MKDVLGTPLYTAPEIIGRKSYDSKVDIWSSTIVIYIMLTGKQPFMGNTKDSLFDDITSRELDFKSESMSKLSKEARSFIKLGL